MIRPLILLIGELWGKLKRVRREPKGDLSTPSFPIPGTMHAFFYSFRSMDRRCCHPARTATNCEAHRQPEDRTSEAGGRCVSALYNFLRSHGEAVSRHSNTFLRCKGGLPCLAANR